MATSVSGNSDTKNVRVTLEETEPPLTSPTRSWMSSTRPSHGHRSASRRRRSIGDSYPDARRSAAAATGRLLDSGFDPRIDPNRIPRHVAAVMDGNGRWARQRGLKRTEGHAAGEEALFDTVEGALELGIDWFTVYAFSTENWRRPADEVRYLMGFNEGILERHAEDMHEPQRAHPLRRPARLAGAEGRAPAHGRGRASSPSTTPA